VKNNSVPEKMPSTPRGDSVDPGVRLSQATPALLDYYSILSMVMGGCCVYVSCSFARTLNIQTEQKFLGVRAIALDER
jgi:hypothetical protein